jgi:hypothetical protein
MKDQLELKEHIIMNSHHIQIMKRIGLLGQKVNITYLRMIDQLEEKVHMGILIMIVL